MARLSAKRYRSASARKRKRVVQQVPSTDHPLSNRLGVSRLAASDHPTSELSASIDRLTRDRRRRGEVSRNIICGVAPGCVAIDMVCVSGYEIPDFVDNETYGIAGVGIRVRPFDGTGLEKFTALVGPFFDKMDATTRAEYQRVIKAKGTYPRSAIPGFFAYFDQMSTQFAGSETGSAINTALKGVEHWRPFQCE